MRSAITSLYEVWGLSVAEVADALNITQRVARLARDGSATADGAYRLDEFLWQVREAGQTDAAAWMNVPVVDGFTATRWNLYAPQNLAALLANARGELADEALLDSFDPDWRRHYWTSFKTAQAPDGGLSVVGKSYDDVIAQLGGEAR